MKTTRTSSKYSEPSREAAAEMATIRRAPAYHLARIWLQRLDIPPSRARTKGLLTPVESVVLLLRASFAGREKGRPTIALALADPDLDKATALALVDGGYTVEERPDRWCDGRHLACNVRMRAMFDMAHSMAAPTTNSWA